MNPLAPPAPPTPASVPDDLLDVPVKVGLNAADILAITMAMEDRTPWADIAKARNWQPDTLIRWYVNGRVALAKRDVPSPAPDLAAIRKRADTLFDAIAHGDDEHRAWLKQAIDDHFAGREVARPAGGGRTDQIARQAAEIERLRALLIRLRDAYAGGYFYTNDGREREQLHFDGACAACFPDEDGLIGATWRCPYHTLIGIVGPEPTEPT